MHPRPLRPSSPWNRHGAGSRKPSGVPHARPRPEGHSTAETEMEAVSFLTEEPSCPQPRGRGSDHLSPRDTGLRALSCPEGRRRPTGPPPWAPTGPNPVSERRRFCKRPGGKIKILSWLICFLSPCLFRPLEPLFSDRGSKKPQAGSSSEQEVHFPSPSGTGKRSETESIWDSKGGGERGWAPRMLWGQDCHSALWQLGHWGPPGRCDRDGWH